MAASYHLEYFDWLFNFKMHQKLSALYYTTGYAD